MRMLALLAVIALVVLTTLNPGMTDFEAFARAHSEELIREEVGGSSLGRALAGAGAGIVSAYLREAADRENYLVYSVYTVDLDGPGREGGEWRFLGIAGQFFELERPEVLREPY